MIDYRINNIMRTSKLALVAALATSTLAACTVKDVDAPPLAGPSSLSRSIVMTADRDTLVQDGSQEAAIRLTALVQPGQSENVRLRAQVFVDGVAQDFGTLSNKNPITPTTIFYRAPAAPLTAQGQVPTTVTIAVTPDDSGDFRAEVSRTIDLRLIPPGVILPSNPNLRADFTFSPIEPKVLDNVSFNASTSTNAGAACLEACTYSWNFGDGTTGTGLTTTHQFRAAREYQVVLTVTDNRGSTAQGIKTVPVAEGTPPEISSFTVSPTPATPNQTVFFNASTARPAPGRSIVSYSWNFGDGASGSGATTSHVYTGVGSFTVTLRVTDDAGSVTTVTQQLTISNAGGTTANMTVDPAAPRVGQNVVFNASSSTAGTGATIVSYKFNYGDGTEEVSSNPVQSHRYGAAGTVTATVEVTDSLGRTSTKVLTVTITP